MIREQLPLLNPVCTNDVTPVCLGVKCEARGTCLRYRAVEYADVGTMRLGFCPNGSLYVPIHPIS